VGELMGNPLPTALHCSPHRKPVIVGFPMLGPVAEPAGNPWEPSWPNHRTFACPHASPRAAPGLIPG
jgi:hypothetical protein